jgi:uncharacterized Zn-binding protein involved in type VI secretion
MPGIARLTDEAVHGDVSAGTGTEASTTVFANGLAVHFLGNTWSVHVDDKENVHFPDPGPPGPPPVPVIAGGCSSTINVDGFPVAMIGSGLSCGAVIDEGSEDVNVS